MIIGSLFLVGSRDEVAATALSFSARTQVSGQRVCFVENWPGISASSIRIAVPFSSNDSSRAHVSRFGTVTSEGKRRAAWQQRHEQVGTANSDSSATGMNLEATLEWRSKVPEAAVKTSTGSRSLGCSPTLVIMWPFQEVASTLGQNG
eukprot:CAMPEP_0170601296 /NCGR_PEP_ID=MMETSP0224-20130122/17785_1 /TAXON_ID=285029 /ORGANISM="Togula jolla, Strain CCCM 725" /LENGTH=147 /DNA_ID=CAMNT_0010926065 /DNA_START=396 /DNA_END=837 /DNA_ORIENTATION=-